MKIFRVCKKKYYQFQARRLLESYYRIVFYIMPNFTRRDLDKLENFQPSIKNLRSRGTNYLKLSRAAI